ncbi:MAG TPA: hypothetical protein VGK67_18570 [Myxococcales bacterium]
MQPPQKAEVTTGGCGCGGEGAFDTWRGVEEQNRALGQTRLGRLIVALRGLVERMTGK